MANDASDTRTRRANGPTTVPVVWHLESQGGRSFTIGVYSGVGERWNASTGKWVQTAKGYFAEISERAISTLEAAGGMLKRYDRNRESIYPTRDEAHTLALRRVRAIVLDDQAKTQAPRV